MVYVHEVNYDRTPPTLQPEKKRASKVIPCKIHCKVKQREIGSKIKKGSKMQNNSEQWKSDGNCSICRRKSYCRKSCAAHKRRVHRIVSNAFIQTMGNIIDKYCNGKYYDDK